MAKYNSLEEIEKNIPHITSSAWNFKDITGQKVGSLTPIYYGIDYSKLRNHQRVWVCQCDCGNYTIVEGYKLANGIQTCCSQQCPYRKTKVHDLTGKKFGRLYVIERAENSKDGHAQWKCECECGNITICEGRYLESERSTSCGNCPDKVKSIGNAKITQILKNNNINFIAEYRFRDCKYKSTLPFDFCILNDDNSIKFLIEYQGNLHHKATGGWITEEHLKEQQMRDKIKKDYCQEHNYKMVIINYNDFNNLEKIIMENINA